MNTITRNYMYAAIAVIVIILAFVLSKHQTAVVPGDATTSSPSATNFDTSASSTSTPVSLLATGAAGSGSQTADSATSQVLIKGSIDLKEIGGTGLTVATGRRVSTTDAAGDFAAMPVLPDHPTILAVSDSASKLRGYAVAFPETGTIVIDARTTAEATLIDPSADLATGRKELSEIDNLKCFGAYVSYLQQQLPNKSLDDIQKATDPNDAKNPHNACIAEIQAMVKAQ